MIDIFDLNELTIICSNIIGNHTFQDEAFDKYLKKKHYYCINELTLTYIYLRII